MNVLCDFDCIELVIFSVVYRETNYSFVNLWCVPRARCQSLMLS